MSYRVGGGHTASIPNSPFPLASAGAEEHGEELPLHRCLQGEVASLSPPANVRADLGTLCSIQPFNACFAESL